MCKGCKKCKRCENTDCFNTLWKEISSNKDCWLRKWNKDSWEDCDSDDEEEEECSPEIEESSCRNCKQLDYEDDNKGQCAAIVNSNDIKFGKNLIYAT